MATLNDLDPVYFADRPWASRLKKYLSRHSRADRFLPANSAVVGAIAGRRDIGLRMAVNIPAYALCRFLRDGRYKNAYECKPKMGERPQPSETRLKVDSALFPKGRANEFYFGSAVLGGTGIRYYGDYCLVLSDDPRVIPDSTQVLDRNSYDVVFAPLTTVTDSIRRVVKRLRGRWGHDLLPIVTLKVLTSLAEAPRLATAGTTSEAVLHDESFVEVHKQGTFGPGDVHEVRESPADAAVEADLTGRMARGHALTPEEKIWLTRRLRVDRRLAGKRLRARIVVTAGRVPR